MYWFQVFKLVKLSTVLPHSTTIFLQGGSQVSLALIRDLGDEGTVRVEYTTSADTATDNQDYVHASGSVLFSPSQRSQTIVIKILEVPIMCCDL